ncbi:hypothetical protein [Candidatus Viridilinea mediisalina]|nr:hypothetical protein [Candidatus Viridilinea mediisalina]
MVKPIVNQYQPDLVSPPGETLEELLEERGMAQAEETLRNCNDLKQRFTWVSSDEVGVSVV